MRGKLLVFASLLMCFVVVQTMAQGGCPPLVEQALRTIGDNCATLDRNSVCYGNNQVSAKFLQEVTEDFFSKPADRANLLDVQSIITTSLDLGREEWGVAVMNVQANVPQTLPGQAVTFILLGDAELENAIAPEDIPAANIAIPVTSRTSSNVRSGPGTNFNRLGAVEANTPLTADAKSEDGAWVRIIYSEDTIAWIFRDNLIADPVMDNLPIPDETARGTMQSFYLRTGIGRTECLDAPAEALLVQGPKDFEVNLTVNGAKVNLGSTVIFQTFKGEQGDELEISVLDGQAEVLPDIEGGASTIIRAGNSSRFCLGAPEDLGEDGAANDQEVTCNGTPPQRIDNNFVSDTLCELQDLPEGLLRYDVDLQCPGDPVPVVVPVLSSTPNQVGATAVPNATTDPNQTASCASVSVIGPYTSAQPYGQVFTWNAVNGADAYQLNFLDGNNNFFSSVGASGTSIMLDPININDGQSFRYEVVALQAGKPLCTSGPIGGINIVSPLTGSWQCLYVQIQVNWSGAGANDVIFIEPFGYPQTTVGSGSSGDVTQRSSVCGTVPSAILSSSSGASITLPGSTCSC